MKNKDNKVLWIRLIVGSIIIALITCFAVLGLKNTPRNDIQNNYSVKKYANSSIVPNNGYISSVYINKYLTTQQTIDILDNANLNYTINPLVEQTPARQQDMYVIMCNSTLSKALVVFRVAYIINGVVDSANYTIAIADYINMTTTTIFTDRYLVAEPEDINVGWQNITPEIIVNSDLISVIPGFNVSVGTQNNLLTNLVSVDPFYDNYSFSNGYNEGYEDGFTDGYNEGIEEGIYEGERNVINNPHEYDLYDSNDIDREYDLGYDSGYNVGYNDGRLEEIPIGLEWFKSAIGVVNAFLEIQILPNVSIGAILSGFVILVLLKWILAWFRG